MKSEKKKVGRKTGYRAPVKRVRITVFLLPERLAALDRMPSSRGKAIEKLLAKHEAGE